MRCSVVTWSLLATLAAISCTPQPAPSHVSLGPAVLPGERFEKPPEEPYDRSSYAIAPRQITAPYVARVPAGVPHTFANAGTVPLNVTAVFPTSELDWTPIGPNPLVENR